jgi:NAD(P)-dependent dehydrogenase (short-subunit alcohol dehydrogenase family)
MPEVSKGVAGKVALVAGGYGGIGEACARALVQDGATVVVAGRDLAKAEAAAQSLAARGSASAVAFDMRDVASMRAAVEQAAARHGGIDFLVNCAGTQEIQPLTEVTEEAFDRILGVNLKGAMFLAHAD